MKGRGTVAVLDGIRVVVTGSAAALDMASLLLSDNGAEVIRVEPPGGDARRGLPAWRLWNRGTRSVVLDPAVAADRTSAGTLIDAADVLLEVQGGAAGLGWSFSYDVLAARNPGLVHCTVTAFGPSGELSGLAPYDGVVEARSGANVDLGSTLPATHPPTAPARTPATRRPISWCSPSPRRCWSGSGRAWPAHRHQLVPGAAGLRLRQRPAPAGRARRARPTAAGRGPANRPVPSLPGLPVQGRPVDADHQQHRPAVPALDGRHRAGLDLGRPAL